MMNIYCFCCFSDNMAELDDPISPKCWLEYYKNFQVSKVQDMKFAIFALSDPESETGISMILDVGEKEADHIIKRYYRLGIDRVTLNNLLWKLEELCLPQIILKYEHHKRKVKEKLLQVQQDNVSSLFETDQSFDCQDSHLTTNNLNTEKKSILLPYPIPRDEITASNTNLSDSQSNKVSLLQQILNQSVISNPTNTPHATSLSLDKCDVGVRKSSCKIKISTKVDAKQTNKQVSLIQNEQTLNESAISNPTNTPNATSLSLDRHDVGVRKSSRKIKVSEKVDDKQMSWFKREFTIGKSSPDVVSELQSQQHHSKNKSDLQECEDSKLCKLWSKKFTSVKNIEDHNRHECLKLNLKKRIAQKNIEIINIAKQFTCEHCGNTFQQRKVLDSHIRKNLGDQEVCDGCTKSYLAKQDLDIHIENDQSFDSQDSHLTTDNLNTEQLSEESNGKKRDEIRVLNTKLCDRSPTKFHLFKMNKP